MRTSYHCHTIMSDGHAAACEYVRAAIAMGLDELGISDHYVLMPPGWRVDWSMPRSALPDYFRTLHAARDEAGDRLIVRYGIEVDYIPEATAELAEILRDYPFDYVIGSIHFVDDFPIDDSAGWWDKLTEDERNDMVRAYWNRVTAMADSRLFDIAAHLDLYKKFGHRPTADVSAEIAAALDAIAAAGMAVELNTAGLHKAANEIYPSPTILRECCRRGIPALVTADAHQVSHLARGYDLGFGELRNAGYTDQAIFAERKITLVRL